MDVSTFSVLNRPPSALVEVTVWWEHKGGEPVQGQTKVWRNWWKMSWVMKCTEKLRKKSRREGRILLPNNRKKKGGTTQKEGEVVSEGERLDSMQMNQREWFFSSRASRASGFGFSFPPAWTVHQLLLAPFFNSYINQGWNEIIWFVKSKIFLFFSVVVFHWEFKVGMYTKESRWKVFSHKYESEKGSDTIHWNSKLKIKNFWTKQTQMGDIGAYGRKFFIAVQLRDEISGRQNTPFATFPGNLFFCAVLNQIPTKFLLAYDYI